MVKERVEELTKELILYNLRTELNQLKAFATTEKDKINKLIDDLNGETNELIREIATLKTNLGIINSTIVLLYRGRNFEDDIKETLTSLLRSPFIQGVTLKVNGNIDEFISNTLLKFNEKARSFEIPDNAVFGDFSLDNFLEAGRLRDFTSQMIQTIFQGALPNLDVAPKAQAGVGTTIQERKEDAETGFLRFRRGSAAGQCFTQVFIADDASNRTAGGFPANPFSPLNIPLDSFCLFISENEINLTDLADLGIMQRNYNNKDLRENYLFDTFDIESLRKEAEKIKKKGVIEKILQMTLYLLVDYKPEGKRWIPANSYIDFLKIKDNNIEANIDKITYDIGNPLWEEKTVGLVVLFVNNPDKWSVFKKGIVNTRDNLNINEIRKRFSNWAFKWNPEEAGRLQDPYLQLLQNLSVEDQD